MQSEPANQAHIIGKWMSFAAWVLFIVLATLLMDRWIKNKYSHLPVHQAITEHNGHTITVIRRNVSNHYLAWGAINNDKILFLLDTGASEVVIPGELAEELGLTPGKRLSAKTAAGKIDVYRTKIDKLTIGHIVLENVNASINPQMEGQEVLLGMNVLNKINFRQQDGTLILTERAKRR